MIEHNRLPAVRAFNELASTPQLVRSTSKIRHILKHKLKMLTKFCSNFAVSARFSTSCANIHNKVFRTIHKFQMKIPTINYFNWLDCDAYGWISNLFDAYKSKCTPEMSSFQFEFTSFLSKIVVKASHRIGIVLIFQHVRFGFISGQANAQHICTQCIQNGSAQMNSNVNVSKLWTKKKL